MYFKETMRTDFIITKSEDKLLKKKGNWIRSIASIFCFSNGHDRHRYVRRVPNDKLTTFFSRPSSGIPDKE